MATKLTTGQIAKRWRCARQTVINIWGSGFMDACNNCAPSEGSHPQFSLEEVVRAEGLLGINKEGNRISNPWFLKKYKIPPP